MITKKIEYGEKLYWWLREKITSYSIIGCSRLEEQNKELQAKINISIMGWNNMKIYNVDEIMAGRTDVPEEVFDQVNSDMAELYEALPIYGNEYLRHKTYLDMRRKIYVKVYDASKGEFPVNAFTYTSEVGK